MLISKHACQFSVERLMQLGEGHLYFWTFTRRTCEDIRLVRKEWHKALIYIRRRIPEFYGVRVFELHPGGHGLHVHIATNTWYGITVVKAALETTGWGRVNVTEWDNRRGDAGSYMAKYLTKSRRAECLKGWRLWAPFGKWEHCRCKDVEYDSPSRRIFNWLMDYYPQWDSLNWYQKKQIHETTLMNYYMREDVEFTRDPETQTVKMTCGRRPS